MPARSVRRVPRFHCGLDFSRTGSGLPCPRRNDTRKYTEILCIFACIASRDRLIAAFNRGLTFFPRDFPHAAISIIDNSHNASCLVEIVLETWNRCSWPSWQVEFKRWRLVFIAMCTKFIHELSCLGSATLDSMPEGHGALIDRACAEFFSIVTDTPLLSPNFSTEFELAQYAIVASCKYKLLVLWLRIDSIRTCVSNDCFACCVRAFLFFPFSSSFYTRKFLCACN